jgi:hypothetical protein
MGDYYHLENKEENVSCKQTSASNQQAAELSQDFVQLLEPLKSIWLFIIQPKVDGKF